MSNNEIIKEVFSDAITTLIETQKELMFWKRFASGLFVVVILLMFIIFSN